MLACEKTTLSVLPGSWVIKTSEHFLVKFYAMRGIMFSDFKYMFSSRAAPSFYSPKATWNICTVS